MSNSNVEKMLDHLVQLKGEKLVIGVREPIFVIKNNRKAPLMNRVLNQNEFKFIKEEFRKIFNNSEEFSHKGMGLRAQLEEDQMEFFPPPLGAAAPEPPVVAPTPPAAPEPPVAAPAPPSAPEPPVVAPAPPAAPEPPVAAPTPPAAPEPPGAQEPVPVASSDYLNLDVLLKAMVERGASDLHVSSGCKPALRVDGDMVLIEEYPVVVSEELLTEIKRIAPERNVREFSEVNDSDFAYSIEGLARFRVNVFRDIKGVGVVFRIIPTKILTVEDLQIPKAVVDLCEIPKGLILVTGPTGSGKSTTLAALIDHINSNQRKHIITIEDPVEFVHNNKVSLLNQREVHSHTKSFKRALRAALREDPDIILVGEMRDLETIAIAIEMAVTGHLVFGTLHTSTAIGTVDRIIDQFPSEQQQQIKTMLADALIGVVAQTLLKKRTGGRAAAFEVLVVTHAVSNLIREGKNYQIATIMQTGKAIGMQMTNTHMLELVEKGLVEPQEALSKAIDKENMRTLLEGKRLLRNVR